MPNSPNNKIALHLLAHLFEKMPSVRNEFNLFLRTLPEQQQTEFIQAIFTLPPKDQISTSDLISQLPRADLKVYSAADALKPQPPMQWVVEQLIPATSVCVLVGAPGSKKTFAMLDLAVCVALGKPWLRFNTSQSNVLIIDEESGLLRMNRRLSGAIRAHGGNETLPLRFTTLANFDLRRTEDLDTISSLILQCGVGLVIMDALADFMIGADENAVRDVQPIFQKLRQLAESCHCAILIIHHVNKNGGYRGSSTILGSPDGLIKQVSESRSNLITFETEKNRDGEPIKFQARIHFELDGRFWLSEQDLSAPGLEEIEKPLSCAETMLRLVENKGDLTQENLFLDLAEQFKESTLRDVFYRLIRKGQLVRREQSDPDGQPLYGLD